jgi:hypothetical protein
MKWSTLLLLLASAFLCTPSASAQMVMDGQGVNIQQATITGTPDTTGLAVVNYSELSTATHMSSGYLNISDSSGNWLVQNLPVFSGHSDLQGISTAFNLSTPSGSMANLAVSYTANPLATYSSISTSSFKVAPATLDNAGESGPDPAAPPNPTIKFNPGGANSLSYQAGHPNVNAADNQCGPAAFANSLTWLQKTYGGLNITEPNVPGRYDGKQVVVPNGPNTATQTNETPGNSLVGTMDQYMGRASKSRVDGDDTTGVQQINGVMNYLKDKGDAGKVEINYQGLDSTKVMDPGGMNPMDKGKPTFDFILSEINRGEDVKIGYKVPGGDGHAVEVVGAGYILGKPYILYESDHLQTPMDQNDNMLNNAPPPLSNLPDFSLIQTDKNGNLFLTGEAGTPGVLNVISISPATPEPSSFVLLALGGGLLLRRRWGLTKASVK